jgi:Flp pilus assembly pilin Flp
LSALLWSLARHRGGVTALEYALIVALLSVTVVPQATSVGKQLSGLMHNIGAFLAGVPLTEPDPSLP